MTTTPLHHLPGLRLTIQTLMVLLLLAGPTLAVVEVAPGETTAPLSAEECATASEVFWVDAFRVPQSKPCEAACQSDCNLGTNTAHVRLSLYSLLSDRTKWVTSTVYTEFVVTDDSLGTGNPVDGYIAYDVAWAGLWELAGVFPGLNDAQVEKSIWLKDLTANRQVNTTLLHTAEPDGQFGIDLIDAGIAADSGNVVSTMSVPLVRGHRYRVAISIKCSGITTPFAEFVMGYMLEGFGIWWNELTVTVAPDLKEELARLTERVDRLEEQLAEHTHTYLTGRGQGHNNTEVETSKAILMDDEPVDDSALVWLPDDTGDITELPTKSLLMHNYPNPSNPATTIVYTLPEQAFTEIQIYNTLGRLVRTLVNEDQAAGEHSVQFDGRDLPSGIYYYRLRAGQYAETRKLTILK